MSLSARETCDDDPLANFEAEEEEEVFVAPVVSKPKPPKPAPAPEHRASSKKDPFGGKKQKWHCDLPAESGISAADATPTKEEPAEPSPAPRVLPEFSGFGAEEEPAPDPTDDLFEKPKKGKKKGGSKEANFGSAAEEGYSTSLFGAADANDELEVEGLFGSEQHKPLVSRFGEEGHERPAFTKTQPVKATNESKTIEESLASLKTEQADDLFLESLSGKKSEPLFPEKPVKVGEKKKGASAAAVDLVDDDLFSMGGDTTKESNRSNVGSAAGFDFDSYIKNNSGNSGGGLFE